MRTGGLPSAPLAWALAGAAACTVAAAAVAAALAVDSTLLALGVVGALALGAWVAWTGSLRRPLIAGLFFLAPVDVSKALFAPVDRFYSPGLYLTPAHVLLLGLGALWLLRRRFVERRRLPFSRLDGWAVAFLAIVVLRSVGSPQGPIALASAAAYGLAVFGFYVASHALEDAADLRLALRAAAAGVLVECGWVAAQVVTSSALALPGAKVSTSGELLYLVGAGAAFRPSGFLSHPNALADHMALVLPPAFALVLAGRARLPRRLWAGALAVTLAGSAMVLVTLSRGGWAACLLGAAWVVLQFTRAGLVSLRQIGAMAVTGGFAFLATVAVYPNLLLRLTVPDQRSTESRLILADQALTIIRAQPWLGVGYGGYNRAAFEFTPPSFAYVSQDYQEALLQLVVHNHYLLLAAELGVPAMGLFVYLLWRFVRLPQPWSRWSGDPGALALAAGLSGAMVAQVLFLASDNYYIDVRIFMLWLTAGLLQALCLQRPPPPPPPPRAGEDPP